MSRFNRFKPDKGLPKFSKGDKIGDFTITYYRGHTTVNQRNNRIMSKAHHWYSCECTCGNMEPRSQQELTDSRRQQKCFECRKITPSKETP